MVYLANDGQPEFDETEIKEDMACFRTAKWLYPGSSSRNETPKSVQSKTEAVADLYRRHRHSSGHSVTLRLDSILPVANLAEGSQQPSPATIHGRIGDSV